MNRDEAEKWCYDRDFFYCCMHPDGGVIYFDGSGTMRRKDPDDPDTVGTTGTTGFNHENRREEEEECWMN